MPEGTVVANNIVIKGGETAALVQLVSFALSLAILPIASYWLSLHYVWNMNYTYAAVTAIAVANLILIAFVLISVLEDNVDTKKREAARVETKKNK